MPNQNNHTMHLYAWADATRKELNDYRPPVEQEDVDRDIDIILESLDQETYAAAYAEGVRMTMLDPILN